MSTNDTTHGNRATRRRSGRLLWLALAAILATPGCGYVKNVRNDFMDCFVIGAGVITPVVKTEEGYKGLGYIPPSIGIYVEATDLLHLGALYKASADIEMDRRATGIVIDQRKKIGFGPFHYVDIEQEPILSNEYKRRNNDMDGWRKQMKRLEDPIFSRPGKQLIYDGRDTSGRWWLHRGWQDWEMLSIEIAIPEPFILHSGINFKFGFDPSQIFDLFLGIFGLDLYGDNAFRFNGDLRYESEDDIVLPERIRY